MPTTIFRPTSSINQNRPKMKISNLCVFCPIWIKFGIWANNGPRITWYKFEMATANFYASTETPHIPSRTIILFRFFAYCALPRASSPYGTALCTGSSGATSSFVPRNTCRMETARPRSSLPDALSTPTVPTSSRKSRSVTSF